MQYPSMYVSKTSFSNIYTVNTKHGTPSKTYTHLIHTTRPVLAHETGDLLQPGLSPAPALGALVVWDPICILSQDFPVGVVITTLVARPRCSPRHIWLVLIAPHWVGDGLYSVAPVTLVAERVGLAKETGGTQAAFLDVYHLTTHSAPALYFWHVIRHIICRRIKHELGPTSGAPSNPRNGANLTYLL